MQGMSGGMSMGSTGPGQSHSSSSASITNSPQKGLGGMIGRPPAGMGMGVGGGAAHGLASPQKQQGQPEPGAASLRGPMLTGPGSHMMGGGGGGGMGGGAGVVLPGMSMRGRGETQDEYVGMGGRAMGASNGQAMEPLSKRPR